MYEALIDKLHATAKAANFFHAIMPAADNPVTALCNEAADAIEELSKPRWIPVTERLPENRSVLIYSADGGVAEGRYSLRDNKWYQYRWGVQNIRVTHWMPRPEPPKEEAR